MQAIWIDRKTIAVPDANGSNYSINGQFPLVSTNDPKIFHVPDFNPEILKGRLSVEGDNYKTGIQIAGVLDDLFAFDGQLGPHFGEYENISIAVWAPTAQSVKLLLFNAPEDQNPAATLPMLEANGVWSVEIEDAWRGKFYLFSVTVFVPKLNQVVENIVTDPYSCDLALNGSKSRLTDLNDPQTKPEGWDEHSSPAIASNAELTIWELHVRDFSANDFTVPENRRGTYLAFTKTDSNGMRHLRRLAEAGIKAVHLLPTFHFASVDEDKSKWQSPGDLSVFPPDSTEQQAAITRIKDCDAFNWGYDPVHFFAPEGSYAVDPYSRVKEYRTMVMALHRAGLRVIQDQVFNHTNSSGQARNSVLDKIVPGYYYRLDSNGNVMSATCCSDTASEHRMMEKLMVDCLVQNVRHYKIDGYRFDLMGFHYVSNMLKIKAALPPDVYLYGEGWFAAETAQNPAKPPAIQKNMYGTGIGTFNDGFRDGIRGGNPFSDPRLPGFVTGNFAVADAIRAGLSGGYGASPIECINYCSVHDNQVLFDAIQLKSPAGEDIATRVRRHILALSLIAFSRGIPFFHAGDELLRSKDMDHNSYNSGDWFNKIDFSYQTNNWGVGLPLAPDNDEHWPIMQPLLANPKLKPSTADILNTRDAFEAFLKIRTTDQPLEFLSTGEGVIAMRAGEKQLIIFNATTQAFSFQNDQFKEPHPELPHNATIEKGRITVPPLTTAVLIQSRNSTIVAPAPPSAGVAG